MTNYIKHILVLSNIQLSVFPLLRGIKFTEKIKNLLTTKIPVHLSGFALDTYKQEYKKFIYLTNTIKSWCSITQANHVNMILYKDAII